MKRWLSFGCDPRDDNRIETAAITQQIRSGFDEKKFKDNDRLQGTIDNIFGMVWITMLTLRLADLGNVVIIRALSEICTLWVLLFYSLPAMYTHILAAVSNAVFFYLAPIRYCLHFHCMNIQTTVWCIILL